MKTNSLEQLQERYADAQDAFDNIQRSAEEQSRDFTKAEKERLKRLDKEMRSLEPQILEMKRQEQARSKELAEKQTNYFALRQQRDDEELLRLQQQTDNEQKTHSTPSKNRSMKTDIFNFGTHAAEAWAKMKRGGGTMPHAAEALMRSIMTPEAGSAGSTQHKATANGFLEQAMPDTSFMRAFSRVSYAGQNNTTFPVLKRDGHLAAQNKDFLDALTKQALVFEPYTPVLHNYYVNSVQHNDVIRDAVGDIESFILRTAMGDVTRQIAEDTLYGSGTNNNIQGLKSYADVVKQDHGSTHLLDYTWLTAAVETLLGNNVNRNNISILMSPAGFRQWANLVDGNGQPLMLPNGIKLANIFVSSMVKEDEGSGNDETTIFVGDFEQVQMFMGDTYTINANQRYVEYDHNAIVITVRVDMQMFQPDHMVLVEGVKATANPAG